MPSVSVFHPKLAKSSHFKYKLLESVEFLAIFYMYRTNAYVDILEYFLLITIEELMNLIVDAFTGRELEPSGIWN